jgi:hypothetical protein
VRLPKPEYELIEVSVRRTCDLRGQWTGMTPECVHTGYIISRPQTGRRLVVFGDALGLGMHQHASVSTTPLTRITGGLLDNEMFLETEDSVYRLVLGRTVLRAPRPLRLRPATAPVPVPEEPEQAECRAPAPLPARDIDLPALPLAA